MNSSHFYFWSTFIYVYNIHFHIYIQPTSVEEKKEQRNYYVSICVFLSSFFLTESQFLICAFIQNKGSRFKSGSMIAVCCMIKKNQIPDNFVILSILRNKLYNNINKRFEMLPCLLQTGIRYVGLHFDGEKNIMYSWMVIQFYFSIF